MDVIGLQKRQTPERGQRGLDGAIGVALRSIMKVQREDSVGRGNLAVKTHAW
jgi:hypothetical protein